MYLLFFQKIFVPLVVSSILTKQNNKKKGQSFIYQFSDVLGLNFSMIHNTETHFYNESTMI